jgi:hypothetical protein
MRPYLNSFTVSFTLHLLVVAMAISRTLPGDATQSIKPTGIAAAHVQAPALPLARPTAQPHESRRNTAGDVPLDFPNATGSSRLDIPNFDFDFENIRRRGTDLFPFLDEDAILVPLRDVAARANRLTFVLADAPGGVARGATKPLLDMSPAAMARLTDRMWSRRERWEVFEPIAVRLDGYDPDRGQLSTLVRTYIERNLLQPYVDTTVPDPRAWTMLGLAAGHRDFIDLITRFAAANPSTKVTTELLFMLDELAQGSRDALSTLMAVNPKRDLWWTSAANRDALGLITVLQRHYRARLERRSLTSPEAVALFYDNVRLGILTAIVAATPHQYRASDARFLMGSIYWRNGNHGEAIRWWREMAPDPSDRYNDAARQLLAAIRGGETPTIDVVAINRILEHERHQWADFWRRRLDQFGYSLTSF